ncbi:MAG TPA: Lrp/AsnC family transcriptional regulator [Saprospiraceae bacterium]|nr:Lrp/AsnC family transcriptional regulator [Saprospiraceae bacterium]
MVLENQFDSLDFKIVEQLSANARIAFSQLAEQLGVSNSLIHQRVKKLRDSGLLQEPVFILNPEVLGYQTSAFCQLILAHAQDIREVVNELKKIPEITECVNTAGRYDVMVRIYAENNGHLRDIIYEKIQSITGVEGTNTVIVFETAFSRSVAIPHFSENIIK